MDTNNTREDLGNVTLTWLGNNETLEQVAQYFNLSVIHLSNVSHDDTQTITQVKLFDLYEMYKTKEKEQLMAYRFVAYILGTLIILSNLTVVISSGLILKKGQQPKSTYLLLGNVSLADTIVGISIIFGALVDHSVSSSPLCVFQIGMLVCPAMVSIFSVGLIAVDRYIYILHGLYYQRWFNTTKVRIGILCIWMIGITLGFMPATGWVNTELHSSKCYYVGLFPGSLILLNSFLSIVPIVIVAVLYSFILVKAVSNVNKIQAADKSRAKSSQKPKLRIFRGNVHNKNSESSQSVKNPFNTNDKKIKRSISFSNHYENTEKNNSRSFKSKSINDLNEGDQNKRNNSEINKFDSEFSICTIESSSTTTIDPSYSHSEVSNQPNLNVNIEAGKKRKLKTPNKWRAITVVMLTSGSFIFTWLPFFIIVIFFVLCEEKLTNPKCFRLRTLLGGPVATLAFLNSILNPIIYAWWHKGFKRIVKMYYSIFFASLPAMGWTGKTFRDYRCWYISLFPSWLLIIVSVVVLSVIVMVCVLYILILHSAVKTVDKIREFRETNISYVNKAFKEEFGQAPNTNTKTRVTITISKDTRTEQDNVAVEMHEISKIEKQQCSNKDERIRKVSKIQTYYGQAKVMNAHPSKLKAVKTVMIVILCFMGTWAPYYVTVIIYVRCDILVNGYECLPLEVLTLGPLFMLGICNSLLDPLIYAWRHSGFKKTLKRMYLKYTWKLRAESQIK